MNYFTNGGTMPRQIEDELITAILEERAFDKRHHAFDPVTRTVTLYGNPIAQISGELGAGLWCSLAGFNTPRTRQTINAVARALVGRGPVLTTQAYQPFVAGRRVSVWEWWPVEAQEGTVQPLGAHGAGRVRLPQPDEGKPA